MKREPNFEIIIDGQVVETVSGWDALDEAENKFFESLDDEWRREYSCTDGSYGYVLMFNECKLIAKTFAWREVTKFVDKDGEPIYEGDYVSRGLYIYQLGQNYSDFLNETDEGYYIQNVDGKESKIPVTVEDIRKRYYVIHKVFPKIRNNLN